ncbi:glycine cleavage system protein H [bacterium]|jgi:glycine cleavage system H protein|nr:glycine cleavage system protein H [bacterium]
MVPAAQDSAPKNGEMMDGKLWFERKGHIVTLGLTMVAIEEIGEVESVSFPDDGADFDRGEVLITVDGVRGSFEVTAPIAGIVNELNTVLTDEPEMVSEDPLEEGWLIKLEIQDPTELKEFA